MQYYLQNVFLGRAASALLLDLTSFFVAAALVWVFASPTPPQINYLTMCGVGAVLVVTAFQFLDLYSLSVLGNARRTLENTLGAMGIVAATFGAVYFGLSLPEGTLIAPATVVAVFFPLDLLGRGAIRLIFCRQVDRVLVIGTSELGRAVARVVAERANLGMRMVGFLSDGPEEPGSQLGGIPILGAVEKVEKIVQDHHVTRIVVASKRREEEFPADALLGAKLSGIRVESGISFFERATGRVYMRDLRPSYLIFSSGFRTNLLQRKVRRVLDSLVALLGLGLSAPLLAMAAMAIKLDSKGSVFFTQTRQGEGGRDFRLIKLRTMRADAERNTGAVWARANDTRTTRVGRLLRKTRLDEVPQLWNVLLGDMSLVGPRPERSEFNDELMGLYPFYRVRFSVKPGITGWAQVRHGYVGDISNYEEKLALDLYYLKNRSISMDLLVLWRTVKTVLLLKGL